MVEIVTAVLAFVGGPVASFFGGAAFRMIFGEVSSWISKKQDHAQEMARMTLQGTLDEAQHARNMASIRLQSDLKVEVIRVQADADIGKIEADGWLEAIKGTTKRVGVKFIDGWNAVMRPAIATWGIVMLTVQEMSSWLPAAYKITLTPVTINVACGAIGIFIAARDLSKRGK